MINSFLKLPIHFSDNITIYPPSVSDVITKSNEFSLYEKIFLISQEELQDALIEQKVDISQKRVPTPFEHLLINAYKSETIKKIVENGIYFFTKNECTFDFENKEIYLCNLEKVLEKTDSVNVLMQIPKLNEANYFDFQNALRESLGKKPEEKYDPNINPKLAAMKAKSRYRDRIKAKQQAKNGTAITLEVNIVAVCCMGFGLNPLNIGEISYAALKTLLNAYQEKEKYDQDMRMLTSGFGSSKKTTPKFWINNDIL